MSEKDKQLAKQDEFSCENSKLLGSVFLGVPSNCKNAHTMTPVPGKNSIGVFCYLPTALVSYHIS